jgi:FKBP-type peptidyl-prolyl cis-trans isomerase
MATDPPADPAPINVTENGRVTKRILRKGTGAKPRRGQKVTVHYIGRLTNGEEFDSSVARNNPFQFQVGKGVITGWSLALLSMKEGEKSEFTLAPEYAYGAEGAPPKIPPNSTLVFEIEFLRINK